MTVTEFLTARLDERQRAAEACGELYPAPWELSDRGWMAKVQADAPSFRIVTELAQEQASGVDGWLSDRLQHIAYHDPALVLADIAAKRAIIAGEPAAPDAQVEWLDIVRLLASPYADHEDYQQEWAPTA